MAPANPVKTNDYLLPVVVSVIMHGLLVVLVAWGWESASEPRQKVVPRHVEARLVALKAEAEKPQPAAPAKPKVIDLTAQQREREAKAAAAEKKRLATEKAERERLRKLAEEKKQRLAEEKKQEQQRKEKERLERERREREVAERQRQEQEAAFADALAQEQQQLMALQSEATAQSYLAAMADRIERNWSRPPSARLGMKCELRIQLVPSGDVVNVTVVKSSGNSAFDRSAEQAVNKVGRFDVLKDMPPDVFERYFRQLTLVFDPRDLRQ